VSLIETRCLPGSTLAQDSVRASVVGDRTGGRAIEVTGVPQFRTVTG
jgi:hypothetical protein